MFQKRKNLFKKTKSLFQRKQDPINFLRYAIFLFEKRNLPYIKVKASGSAISSLVNLPEIIKKIIPEIHQINRIYTLKIEQDYKPKEKGLDNVTIIRNVPILDIFFSKVLPDADLTTLYGYQPALSKEVFERVKINVNNLLRNQLNSNGNQKNRGRFRGRGKEVFMPCK